MENNTGNTESKAKNISFDKKNIQNAAAEAAHMDKKSGRQIMIVQGAR